MSTLPLSDVKARLSEIVESVDQTHERVTITKNGRNAAVLVAVEDWESLEETLAILSDQQLLLEVFEAERGLKAGEPTVTLSEMEQALQVERDVRDRRGRQ